MILLVSLEKYWQPQFTCDGENNDVHNQPIAICSYTKFYQASLNLFELSPDLDFSRQIDSQADRQMDAQMVGQSDGQAPAEYTGRACKIVNIVNKVFMKKLCLTKVQKVKNLQITARIQNDKQTTTNNFTSAIVENF